MPNTLVLKKHITLNIAGRDHLGDLCCNPAKGDLWLRQDAEQKRRWYDQGGTGRQTFWGTVRLNDPSTNLEATDEVSIAEYSDLSGVTDQLVERGIVTVIDDASNRHDVHDPLRVRIVRINPELLAAAA